MKKGFPWIVAVVLAAAAMAASSAFGEGLKVAVIDVNKVLNESEAGKAAKKKMDARSEEARKMKEDLDKQKVLLGKEKLKEREDALNAKVAELRQLSQESEKEMQNRQGEVTRGVLRIVEAQVDKVVKEEKIDLLLEKSSGVVHSDPSLDITAKVLDLVNKENPGGKRGPAHRPCR